MIYFSSRHDKSRRAKKNSRRELSLRGASWLSLT